MNVHCFLPTSKWWGSWRPHCKIMTLPSVWALKCNVSSQNFCSWKLQHCKCDDRAQSRQLDCAQNFKYKFIFQGLNQTHMTGVVLAIGAANSICQNQLVLGHWCTPSRFQWRLETRSRVCRLSSWGSLFDMGKIVPFNGVREDLRGRLACYKDDWTGGFNSTYRCLFDDQ